MLPLCAVELCTALSVQFPLYIGPPLIDCACILSLPFLTPAAEAWFERHGLPCPAGTAIAEHMLKVASDAADTKRLLECLAHESDQAATKAAGASPFAAAAGHRRTTSNASSRSESEARRSIGKSPFESPAVVPEGLPLPGTHRHRLSTGGSSDMSEVPGHTAIAGKAEMAAAPHHHRRG